MFAHVNLSFLFNTEIMGKLVKEKNWKKIVKGLTICNIYITFAHEDNI